METNDRGSASSTVAPTESASATAKASATSSPTPSSSPAQVAPVIGSSPPAARVTGQEPSPTGVEPASVYREAATFVAWGAGIILLAHGVEVASAGAPNWTALAIRALWAATLLAVAAMLRTGRRSIAFPGAAIGILSSAALDLALLWVTGRSASPLLAFTPVLAMVLPFVAFDAIWLGLAAGGLLLVGTGFLMIADGVSLGSFLSVVNAGGGALVCGWLLARAFKRSRQAERRRREELADAMASLRTLRGMLPLCAWCRRVRSDAGYWEQIEAYISSHSDATFTHGICQDCEREHFPDLAGEPDSPAEVAGADASPGAVRDFQNLAFRTDVVADHTL